VTLLSIAGRSFIVIVFAAILGAFGCTRASSPTTRTRSLKPTLSTRTVVRNKPVEAELPMSSFLPIESW
jgi:hypothetical protein